MRYINLSFTLFLLLMSVSVSAEMNKHADSDCSKTHIDTDSDCPKMYKHIDADGVTTFSDIEVEGATEIKPTVSNTMAMPKPVVRKKSPEEPKPAVYSTFIITSPQHDSTVRNNSGIVTLGLSLTPELNIDSGHRIWAYIDDQMTVSNSTSLIIPINNVYRGSHTIYAVVRDSKQNSLIQSKIITIHFKQTSRLH